MLQGLGISCVLIGASVCLVHYMIRGRRKGELIDKMPGPYAWPIIGSMARYMVPLDQLWTVLHEMNNKYYPIHRIWQGNVPMVQVHHPDDIEILLSSSKHIEKSIIYKFLQPWLGTGLLTSTGKKWHQRRKILTPAFHFSVLQQFVGIFAEQSDKLVESLCPDDEQVIEDLVSLLHQYTLDSIRGKMVSNTNGIRFHEIWPSKYVTCPLKKFLESAMGSTCTVDSEVLNEYRSCVHEMGALTLYRVTRPWLYIDWLFRYSKRFVDQCRVLKVLHGFSTNIITERKQYHKDTDGRYLKGLGADESVYSFEDDNIKGKRRLAMLDLLISAQQEGKVDDEGIREEVDTFVFEGHDTTAMGLCFALLLLAEHKEIQNKARAEVDGVFREKGGDKFAIRDLQRLGYLERCIKESLRLFPAVPFISRKLSGDLQLKNYLVPDGTIVNVFIWDLHRDPNFWPNPTVYDPDRFLAENSQGRHPFAFAPFSAGPRNCIGQKFAMLEAKALIGNILHKFYLEPIDVASKVQITTDLILRPLNPVRIKLVRRSSIQ